MTPNFVIYRSSAGSGKTFTLVKEYLLLALRNPDDFNHILAITFTNKAMQEMKSRIIEYLQDFIDSDDHPMKGELIRELNYSEVKFQERCLRLRNNILHKYSDFHISTIDAFFQRIIRSFTKELGLYSQYQIELDQKLVLMQAVDKLLANLEEKQMQTRWIISFAENELDEGNNWDISRSLVNLGMEMFKEHFYWIEKELKDVQQISALQKKIEERISIIKNHLQGIATPVFEYIEKEGISVDEFSRKESGAISFLYQIHNWSLNDDGPAKYPLKGLDNVDVWVKKKCDRRDLLLSVAENILMPANKEAISYYEKFGKEYNSLLAARRSLFQLGLLADLLEKVKEYKEENDVLFISDATRMILGILEQSDSPFVFEKMGTFYQNYLVDEFQDTSQLQWQCLRPLISDALASGQRSLLVGDTKQSIYRWRGGDWSLLQKQVETDVSPQPLDYQNLSQNFRSAEKIIDFNNAFFTTIPSLAQELLGIETTLQEDKTKFYFDALQNVYNEATQQPHSKTIQGGYVHIEAIDDKEDEENWREIALEKLRNALDDAIARGYHKKDIALLVRRAQDGAEVAGYLLKHKDDQGNSKYPVLTTEALQIGKAQTIQIIISTMASLLAAEDKIALAEIAFHYQKVKNGKLLFNFHELTSNEKFKELLPEGFWNLRKQMQHLSLEEAVEAIIRVFDLPGKSGEEAYIQTFQDKILDFAGKEGNDFAGFLEWWEQTGKNQSIEIPKGIDAITILTIHKAKGLQYPVVMLPFASWKLNAMDETLWVTTELDPFKGHHLNVSSGSKLEHTYFKEAYHQEKIQNMLDHMNMLYVAFTRAEKELYCWLPTGLRSNTRNTIDAVHKLLNETLDSPQFNYRDHLQNNIFTFGKKLDHSSKKSSEYKQVRLREYLSFNWRNRIVVKKVDSSETTAIEQAARGRKLHYYLSRIKYEEDMEKMPFFQSIMEPDEKKLIAEAVRHPHINEFFQKDWKVLNEKSILYQHEIYRPDRVVVKENEAVVIDYKWGASRSKYEKQVLEYVVLMKKMGYSKVSGLLFFVDDNKVEKIA